MRRFLVRFVLGVTGGWLGSVLLPGITTDRELLTFALFGFFFAVSEVILPVFEGGAAVLLFFLPRGLRFFLLRTVAVTVAVALTTGYEVSGNALVALGGLTLLLSLLSMLPFAH